MPETITNEPVTDGEYYSGCYWLCPKCKTGGYEFKEIWGQIRPCSDEEIVKVECGHCKYSGVPDEFMLEG